MKPKKKILFPAKRVVLIIFIAAALILIIDKVEPSTDEIFPFLIGLLAIGVFCFLLNLFAKFKFRYLIWGLKAMKMKRFPDAEQNFKKFNEYLTKYPKVEIWKKLALGVRQTSIKAMTYFYIGVATFKQVKTEEALENFLKATKILPDFPEAQFDAAIACAKLNRNQEALMWLGKISNTPEHLKENAKTASEFKSLQNDKLFKKFIS